MAKRVILRPLWLDCPETRTILSVLQGEEEKVRFVGGCVRDLIIRKPSPSPAFLDLDLATILRPLEAIKLLEEAHIKVIPTGLSHGSILAVLGLYRYEITSLRQDIFTDGRHAKVAFTDDWEEDAKRRDFTFNALYLSSKGELYDPWEGEKDLLSGQVRFIGNAEDRIKEDYLRILRYFRFYGYYGRGKPNSDAIEACKKYAEKINNLSGERIRNELLKLLSCPNPAPALHSMMETGVLTYLVQGWEGSSHELLKKLQLIENLIKIEQEFQSPPKAFRRLVALFQDNANALELFIARFKLSNQEKKEVHSITRASNSLCLPAHELLYQYGLETTQDALLIQAARGYNRLLLESLPSSWTRPSFPLSGKDLEENGLNPGPLFGKALMHTEKWWVSHSFQPNASACLEEAIKYYRSVLSEKL